MKKIIYVLLAISMGINAQDIKDRNAHYITNQAPLIAQPYTHLPLGTIKPKGWLHKMMKLQRDGLTGKLDSIYSLVCGPTNGWLGGEGDGWERGPYWLDGLVPLAYILDDKELKEKAQEWIDWSIENQREDGYFGPRPLEEGYTKIKGVQQGNREDWWPKMVMLKVLQQYYSATEDKRVLELMRRYFKYQLNTLKEYPLGHWTFWGNRRGADNLAVVYWLYNSTQEDYLLDLAELINKQTYDWTLAFTDGRINKVNPLPRLHCVNVAQGLKAPLIYYQHHPEQKYIDAVKKGLAALKKSHGYVNGMYGGDEPLHGNDPTQGSELCSATEMMFSFESVLPITGDVYYADYLEKIAFNVLPTQHDDAFLRKQYFQQANQVQVTDDIRNFFNDDYARIVYGVLTGYPCCTTNMHQGWPKFVQNLWYATADNGLAALVYGASEVRAKVADGIEVSFKEETQYPFDDTITFKFNANESVKFPFHLRIPLWAKDWNISVNNSPTETQMNNNVVVLDRIWENGDEVKLTLPMKVRTSSWYERSVGVERGPLVYALKMKERWEEKSSEEFPHSYYEVYPESHWNYGILDEAIEKKSFSVTKKNKVAEMPWNVENAPISLNVAAAQLSKWKLYNHSAGKIPVRNRIPKSELQKQEITLIPYGCTTLRISQFPIINVLEK
ncbi:beta-L-arabinofuranosidase domain-containing protein [Allomuricauda sp. SCSIO 65647]|uniref:beta-L-arabinofuranosidase domain-containing protein n=1 Tax=Allomuricauda sp. SCSIO 65647 TaxID=2908843 RepID=UPI001F15E5E0|nr:beta-L-arabinofuranosidase domain-containing protein [Muricauda sp. SCSIO 65647]UJH67842.1 glycoside hydrolase family 127 protein [Muricauda sp. SCSIO 65647]